MAQCLTTADFCPIVYGDDHPKGGVVSDSSVAFLVHTVEAGIILWGAGTVLAAIIMFGFLKWKKWL